jgi:hypothetical protein
MPFATGTLVDDSDLRGCNIEALVQGGHLVLASSERESVPPALVKTSKTTRHATEPQSQDTADAEEQD